MGDSDVGRSDEWRVVRRTGGLSDSATPVLSVVEGLTRLTVRPEISGGQS